MTKGSIFLLLFCLGILALSIRGIPGNPDQETLNNPQWREEGPLELSPDRGRFALLYSLVEDRSFSFSLPIARFVVPDLGYKDGEYVSLFAPGVSFALVPGYLIGKTIGLSQLGAFASIVMFAIANVMLIRAIAIKLGSQQIAATIASLLYLFATPAFAYSVSLYQHQISTSLLLVCLYVYIATKSKWWLAIVWLSAGFALSVDYPNAFFFFPIILVSLWKMFEIRETRLMTSFSINPKYLITFLSVVVPMSFFLWSNFMSYGNPLQLAGTIGGVRAIDAKGKPMAPENTKTTSIVRYLNPDLQQKSALGFFQTRNLPNGMYIHTISPDRGTLYYAPIAFIGLLGLLIFAKKDAKNGQLLLAIVGIIFLLYSMWGDPYGGWAFGSRYMIPAYAVLCITLGIFLTKYAKNVFILVIVALIGVYSVSVNTIGALTSNRNPPQVEILDLESRSEKVERYTVQRNMELLDANRSKSFVFQVLAKKHVDAWQYTRLIIAAIFNILLILLIFLYRSKPIRHDQDL